MNKITFASIASFSLIASAANATCVVNSSELSMSFSKLSYTSIFPIKISGFPTAVGPMMEGIDRVATPVCQCPGKLAGYPQIGVPVGFYNPDRMIDVVNDKFCFVGLGIPMNVSGMYGDGADDGRMDGKEHEILRHYQVHNITYPIFGILKMFLDLFCLSPGSNVDIAYITEVDPLWNSDPLAAIIQPEAILFGNPITQLACAADGVASSTSMALDAMFWCKGTHGSVYPLTGRETASAYMDNALGAAESFIFKSHRQLLTWKQSGMSSLCFAHPMPVWVKSSHRMQLFAPIPHVTATWFGASEFTWGWGKKTPVTDNFSFFWFRKFDCCFL